MGIRFPYLIGKARERAEAATLGVYYELQRLRELYRRGNIQEEKRRPKKHPNNTEADAVDAMVNEGGKDV